MASQPISSADLEPKPNHSILFESFLAKLGDIIDKLSPSPETLAARAALDLQQACCGLLMEVARLDAANAEQKREAVAKAMRQQFGIPNEQLMPMIESAGRPNNRLTSYYRPVSLINQRFEPARKAQFVEQLWRVAMIDGKIDMYEDHLVRKFADLLYVAHSDFILAKNRAQASHEPRTD
jgi:uncharacterized tellurite resistance protein B-like protein